MTRHLENAGLLDFELVQDTQIPALCHRAACWPEGMPQTIDARSLGIDRATVEEEEKRRANERQRRFIEKRSIDFAGKKLDTTAASFAEELRQAVKRQNPVLEGIAQHTLDIRDQRFPALPGREDSGP